MITQWMICDSIWECVNGGGGSGLIGWRCYVMGLLLLWGWVFLFSFLNLTICEQKACRWIYCCHIYGRLRFLGFFFFLGIWVVFTCLCFFFFFFNVLSSFMPISSYLLVLLQKSFSEKKKKQKSYHVNRFCRTFSNIYGLDGGFERIKEVRS